jgi:hypothetical protein
MPAEVALNPEASEGSPNRGSNGYNGEGREAGRRNRRPRRGERARPEANDDNEPASDGLTATLSRGTPAPQEPVDDKQNDGDTALIDADN